MAERHDSLALHRLRYHTVVLLAVAVACGNDHGAHPDGPVDGPLPDAGGTAVHGAITSIETVNDGSGNPVGAVMPPDTSLVALTVTHADGTSASVALGSDGTFAFDVAALGDPYRLTVAVQGEATDDYESSSPELAIRLIGAGHIPRAPVNTGISINTTFTNWVDGDVAVLATTGLWAARSQEFVTTPFGSATEPWQFQWLWQDVPSLSGPLGLLDASQNDRLFVTEWHEKAVPEPYESITASFGSDGVTMTDGSDIDLPSMAIAPIAQRCAKVIAPRRSELARVTAALPDSYVDSTEGWTLEIAAGSGIGAVGAQGVADGTQISGIDGSGTDANVLASFGDPFGGSTMLLSLVADQTRAIAVGSDDQPAFLAVGTESIVELPVPDVGSCGASAAVAQATPTVAIASIPVATGTSPVTLGSDDAVVAVAAGSDVAVSWTLAAAGSADEYAVQLMQVSDDGLQATLTVVRTVFTTARSTTFDTATTLQPGNLYVLRVFAREGFRGASSGDFGTITFPFASEVTVSHTFTVAVAAGSGSG